ncbi:hypothetical protein LTR85_003514 [Meristemomyces frigidus]|nr:hypothetical protein LTR85_003514 [Meristemomyces frigidus]
MRLRKAKKLACYEAISYTWGDPDDVGIVLCHDKELVLPANLVEALLQFRSAENEQYLCADAICLDQNNIEERSAQVRIMGDIFAAAARVLVWLGVTVFPESADRQASRIEYMETYGSLHWSLHKHRGLAYVLDSTRSFQARDPRDHVYAQYSQLKKFKNVIPGLMAPDGRIPCTSLSLLPDYSNTVECLYTEIASHLIDLEGLDILAHVEHSDLEVDDHANPRSFPTWVPQWQQVRICTGLLASILRPEELDGSPRRAALQRTRFDTGDFRELGLNGIVYDVVSSVDPCAMVRKVRQQLTLEQAESGYQYKNYDDDVEPDYWHTVKPMLRGRVTFGGLKTRVGVGPAITHPGDLICLFELATLPFILRRKSDDSYLLVGECYICKQLVFQHAAAEGEERRFVIR